jgi:tripartite-type tricarboxylate transporter receptor subunit TctC
VTSFVIAALVAVWPARAQDYPLRPVTMVAPVAAGGDAIARILAEGWRSQLGQPVIVETSAAPTA